MERAGAGLARERTARLRRAHAVPGGCGHPLETRGRRAHRGRRARARLGQRELGLPAIDAGPRDRARPRRGRSAGVHAHLAGPGPGQRGAARAAIAAQPALPCAALAGAPVWLQRARLARHARHAARGVSRHGRYRQAANRRVPAMAGLHAGRNLRPAGNQRRRHRPLRRVLPWKGLRRAPDDAHRPGDQFSMGRGRAGRRCARGQLQRALDGLGPCARQRQLHLPCHGRRRRAALGGRSPDHRPMARTIAHRIQRQRAPDGRAQA
ncbi:hypothetical protein D3C72_1266810 [compost metagenome]